METMGIIGFILGLLRIYWGLCRANGKENGNYCSMLGLYRDKGQEKWNY